MDLIWKFLMKLSLLLQKTKMQTKHQKQIIIKDEVILRMVAMCVNYCTLIQWGNVVFEIEEEIEGDSSQ
jgi:hypothetical protein